MNNNSEKIILAAYPLFMENGYKKTTTAEIARIAGINESTLFRNFKSKENLFQVSIEYFAKKAIEVDFNILEYTGDLQVDMRRMIHSLYATSIELIPSFRLLIKQSLISEKNLATIKGDTKKQKNLFIHYIQGLISRNLIKDIDSEIVYDLIFGKVFVSSFDLLTKVSKEKGNFEELLEIEVDKITEYFVTILKNEGI